MADPFSRTRMVLGTRNMDTLRHARIIVFGAGGVGGSCIEALARCGVGRIDVVDNDKVSLTNLNRQALATMDTIGMYKTDAAQQKIHSISPDTEVHKYTMFYLPETADQIDLAGADYIIDCIDTVTAKLYLIETAKKLNIPIICSMGTGNRVDPSRLLCTDLFQTQNDGLARVMRRECRKRGITSLKVVCSKEKAVEPIVEEDMKEDVPEGKRSIPGSTSLVPPAAGILIASVVIRDLTHFDPEKR